MGRTSVVAEEFKTDALDEACIALGIEDDKCQILREAAQLICPRKAKRKREPTEYQKFMSSCMKGENIKKFEDAPKAMKKCVAKWRVEKEKRGLS